MLCCCCCLPTFCPGSFVCVCVCVCETKKKNVSSPPEIMVCALKKKLAKMYTSPVIKEIALGLPVLTALNENQRTAVLIGKGEKNNKIYTPPIGVAEQRGGKKIRLAKLVVFIFFMPTTPRQLVTWPLKWKRCFVFFCVKQYNYTKYSIYYYIFYWVKNSISPLWKKKGDTWN